MTLEDFFTLTEIKDGLMATSRVEELVSVMQSSKDSVVKNVGDASRQWAAVASTISATKNKECLDAFIRLDGLFYICRWLIDAQKLASDSTDSSLEEAILGLLQALENLGVDGSKIISSGICHSIKALSSHVSIRIQDLARKLFHSWKLDNVYDCSECKNESIHILHEDEIRVITASGENSGQILDTGPLRSRESNNGKPPLGVVDEAGNLLSGSSEENKPDKVKGLEPQSEKVCLNSDVISRCSNTKAEASDGSLHGEIMNAVQDCISLKEKGSMKDMSDVLHQQYDSDGRPSETPAAEIAKDKRQIGEHELSTEALGAAVIPVASCSVGTTVASAEETKKEPLLQKSLSKEMSRNSSEALEDVDLTHNCTKQEAPLTHEFDKYESEALSGFSVNNDRHREDEGFGVPIVADDETEKVGKDANIKKKLKRRKKHSSRSMTVSQRLGAIDKSTADIELGIVDALEVATKVAQEIARDADSREPSCDSSEELSDECGQSDSSDSIHEEQDTLGTVSPSNEAPVSDKHSVEAPQDKHDHLMDLKDNKLENGMSGNDIEPCQVTAERSLCDFDLNEEINPDETDLAVSSVPTLVPVLTVSRPVAAPGVPPAMVSQLERTVGWKGSASTSAFHPASPHKISGGDLREKQLSLGIDLNVAEEGDEMVDDSTPWKQFPFSSNSRSTETPVELAESGRFNLDLNCTNEDDVPPPSELRMETRLFLNRNSHQSASPASSSSSAQHLTKKVNIDLNDGPQFLIDSSDQGSYYGRQPWNTIPHGGQKSDGPIISILGAKVEVSRKDSLSTVPSFLPNGKSLDTTLDLNIARTGNSLGFAPSFSYLPSPTYGYNGLTATPGSSFSSPMYVPGNSIPYMMDSRGAPVVIPQVIGPAPHVQPAYAQQHFFMSMPCASPSLNGLGPMRPNFDRSLLFGVEGGNRETLSLRQFLSPGHSGTVGEQAGAGAEPSSGSSMVGGKRKEPETGWEPNTLKSRPQYPPWR